MGGRGSWLDNVFIQRLRRSMKYQDVYLEGYADGRKARARITAWIAFYNARRPHAHRYHNNRRLAWRDRGVRGRPASNQK